MERDHYPVWQRRQMARLAAQGATIDCNLDGFRVRRGQHSVWCPRDPRHFLPAEELTPGLCDVWRLAEFESSLLDRGTSLASVAPSSERAMDSAPTTPAPRASALVPDQTVVQVSDEEAREAVLTYLAGTEATVREASVDADSYQRALDAETLASVGAVTNDDFSAPLLALGRALIAAEVLGLDQQAPTAPPEPTAFWSVQQTEPPRSLSEPLRRPSAPPPPPPKVRREREPWLPVTNPDALPAVVERLVVYCDGSGTLAQSGAGAGLVALVDGQVVAEVSQAIGIGTNNYAECWAIGRAVALASELAPGVPVTVVSDSEFAIGATTPSCTWHLRHNDRTTAVALRARAAVERHGAVTFRHVRGHVSVASVVGTAAEVDARANGRADELAKMGRQGSLRMLEGRR